MEFNVSPNLLNLIERVKKRLIIDFYVNLFILILFSILLSISGSFDLVFYVSEPMLIVGLGLIQYTQIVSKGKIINKTTCEVIILKEQIIVRTPPFKVLFWINKSALELKFEVASTKLRKVPYSLKTIYSAKDFVWELSYRENKVYIINDYFDSEMETNLQSLKGLQIFS